MYKHSFWEVGQWLQSKAKTKDEAIKCFVDSCSKCNKQAICNEKFCPIAKTHETKLLLLEAEASQKRRERSATVYYTTRPYKPSTPHTKAKKAVLNFLTRISKEITKEEIQLIVDDASVMAELGELESCYWVLRNGKLLKTAEKVKSIISKVEEVR